MSVGPGLKSVICVAEAGSGDYRIEAGLGRGAAALAVFVSAQEAEAGPPCVHCVHGTPKPLKPQTPKALNS